MQSLGIPAPTLAAVVVSPVEFLGGAALVLGLLTRWAALLLAIDMVVAILVVHIRKDRKGFFLPNGIEFHLVLLGADRAHLLRWPAAAAVDSA